MFVGKCKDRASKPIRAKMFEQVNPLALVMFFSSEPVSISDVCPSEPISGSNACSSNIASASNICPSKTVSASNVCQVNLFVLVMSVQVAISGSKVYQSQPTSGDKIVMEILLTKVMS